MILLVYLGTMGWFHPACSSFIFLQNSFWEGHVLRSKIEERREKKSWQPP